MREYKLESAKANLEAVDEITATSLAVGSRFLEGTALSHHEFVTGGVEGTQISIRGRAGMRASVHRELCEYYKALPHLALFKFIS